MEDNNKYVLGLDLIFKTSPEIVKRVIDGIPKENQVENPDKIANLEDARNELSIMLDSVEIDCKKTSRY